MTKREFLDELKRLTGAMSGGEQARLLAYYAEMIDDRMEEGVPEAEAVAALGDPAALASALATVPRAGEAGGSEAVAALANLRVRVTGADVVVRREALTNGAAAQLRFSDPAAFAWRMDGDTLEVTQPEADAPRFSLNWLKTMITAPAQRVTVALADGLAGALDYEGGGGDLRVEGVSFAKAQLISASGDIELKDVDCAGGIGIDIRTHSGDVELTDVRSANMIVNAASGDFTGKSLTLSGRLRLETASGDIEIERGRAGETDIRAASGDVELNALECDPFLSVETANGDIDLTRCVARETNLKSASGDVDLRLEPLPCGYDISVNTVNGDIDIDDSLTAKSAREQPIIVVRTVSGDVSARAAR